MHTPNWLDRLAKALERGFKIIGYAAGIAFLVVIVLHALAGVVAGVFSGLTGVAIPSLTRDALLWLIVLVFSGCMIVFSIITRPPRRLEWAYSFETVMLLDKKMVPYTRQTVDFSYVQKTFDEIINGKESR